MSPWLVTGANGFLGRQVLDRIRTRDEVYVLGRRPPLGWPAHRFLRCDLSDSEGLRHSILGLKPGIVLHLAGRTPPATSEHLYQTNVIGTLHLLDALRALNRPVRLILAGSAAELGPVAEQDLPVGEDYPPCPTDAYGLSKHLAGVAALAAGTPIEVLLARVFNPIGPGLPESQAFGRFARELATPGTNPRRLRVGDLDTRRDFVDVRDVASAIVLLATRGSTGIYHLGTGRSRPVRDGLNLLIELSRLEVELAHDPRVASRPGPSDSRADVQRIINETGWSAGISFEESLVDLWRDVRQRLALTDQGATV